MKTSARKLAAIQAWKERNREKVREASKRYYEANKEKIRQYRVACLEREKEYQHAYRAAHTDTHKVRGRIWYAANRELVKQRSRIWAQLNPEKRKLVAKLYNQKFAPRLRMHRAKRRAVELRATPVWANLKAMEAIYAEAKRLTKATGIPHHVDHYYPLRGRTVCGLHVEYNLQILTKAQNLRKQNKHPESLVA